MSEKIMNLLIGFALISAGHFLMDISTQGLALVITGLFIIWHVIR